MWIFYYFPFAVLGEKAVLGLHKKRPWDFPWPLAITSTVKQSYSVGTLHKY